jgi:pimeloyl-ACP methyl ester carboxylesterase
MPFPYRGERKKLDDDTRKSASGKFIQLSKGLTHYELSGPQTGKTVALIHGIAGPLGIWRQVTDPLTRQGFRILKYDLYGRGYSDRPDVPYDIDLFINQLDDLLSGLSITLPVTLVGWSLGGMISVVYAARYPKVIDRLFLIAPAGIAVSLPAISRVAMTPLLGEILMSLLGRPMVLRSLGKGLHMKDLKDEYRSLVSEQMQYRGYLRSFLSTLRWCAFEDVSEEYRTIGNVKLPVLMISGSKDPFISSAARDRIAELIPRLEYKEIPGTGHIPHFEQPEEVIHLLLNFIAKNRVS